MSRGDMEVEPPWGTGADSGAELRTPSFAIIWTLENSQAVRMEAHPTRAEAIETVGLIDR